LPEQFDLVAVYDLDIRKARECATTFEISRIVGSLDELCRMDDLDIIDLCTPPSLHFVQLKQVLEAGKHAICEKPLVGSLRDVDELAALEARSGRWIMPIFQYRFGHGLQKLKRLVDAGVAGRPYLATVETAWRRRAAYYDVPWRGKWATELGGALISHAIHAHDMLTYILGPIRSVFCRTATLVNPIEVEDTAVASLEFANGALATLAVTLGSSAEITRHRFCFAGLTAESNTSPYRNSSEPWTFTPDTPEHAQQIDEALAGFALLPEGFPGQFLRAYAALREGAALPVTLADARIALELVTALYASARTGETVQLPLAPDHLLYDGWTPSARGEGVKG
jgi:predicted dehydrogenase